MTRRLVLVCGSYSTGAAWGPLISHLPGDFAVETVTLPGYGGVPDPRDPDAPMVEPLADAVAAAALRLGGPVHVAGHSFGFQPTLAAVLSDRFETLSLTGFEGNLYAPLVLTGREDAARQLRDIRATFQKALAAGDPDAARIILDFWGHEGAWDSLPQVMRDFTRAGLQANLRDWQGLETFSPDLTKLTRARIPLGLVRGALANAVTIAIADALAELIPGSMQAVIAGANHFLISTHPHGCAEALMRNIERA